MHKTGNIVLFGSGEALASSGQTHEHVARNLGDEPCIAILETPAGFELNSDRVAGRIADYFERRLQNYHPQIEVIPARKKGTAYSPDDARIVAPLLHADWVMLGPGSPTYAVRQLQDSLAWYYTLARFQLGATVMLSSSAVLAASAYTMPVYEIYKVGEDLHWKEGLSFFELLGLPLVVIPHWNNTDGGDELDTSRCYVGRPRFDTLRTMLPPGQTILGIDEHTSLIIDPAAGSCLVKGNGRIVVLRGDERHEFLHGKEFALDVLGAWQQPSPGTAVPESVWQTAVDAQEQKQAARAAADEPSPQVRQLVAERTAAREQEDWQKADALRDEIAELGWQVQDTPDGPQLERL